MQAFRIAQDKLVIELIAAATSPTTAAGAPATMRVSGGSVIPHIGGVTWDQVIRAGMDYADRRNVVVLDQGGGLFTVEVAYLDTEAPWPGWAQRAPAGPGYDGQRHGGSSAGGHLAARVFAA